MKLSEQAIKVSNPGILQVRRYFQGGEAIGDVIFDEQFPIHGDCTMVDPLDMTQRKMIPAGTASEDLLVPVFAPRAVRAADLPSLEESRARVQEQLGLFHAGIKRFVNPHQYPVGLELGLHERKDQTHPQGAGFRAMTRIRVAAAVLNQTPLDWAGNEQNILAAIRSCSG